VIFTALLAMIKVGEKALPLAIWQSRQWQLSIRSGGAEHSYRMAPQAQPPVNGISTLLAKAMPNVRAHARARKTIDQRAMLLARRGGARG